MKPTSVRINIDYDNGTSEIIEMVADKSLEIKIKGDTFSIKGHQHIEEEAEEDDLEPEKTN